MTINKYYADTLKAAIDKARADLGPEAKVVHVRQLDKYSAHGVKSSDPNGGKIEIIAAIDDEEGIDSSETSTKDEKNTKRQAQLPKSSKQSSGYIPTPTRGASESTREHRSTSRNSLENVSSSYEKTFLKSLKERIPRDDSANAAAGPKQQMGGRSPEAYTVPRQRTSPEPSQDSRRDATDKEYILEVLHKCCSRNQVDASIMYELISLLNDKHKISAANGGSSLVTPRDYMSYLIADLIGTSGGLDAFTRTAILIGPTGVGKTTTLAKLAAQYHFQEEKSVGLITIDAYRIAAINQLQTYAQIMSIPLKVALTPEELEQCIMEYDDMDLILVDTPGRSQFNGDALNVLQEFLEAAQPADTHLLLATSTKESDAYAVAASFAPEYVRQLIFTKTDETAAFGSILNICKRIGKPVSYLTTGQNVPDDIEVAQVERMADLFLNTKRSTMNPRG